MAKIELTEYAERIDRLIKEDNYEQAAYHCLYILRQFPRYLHVYKQLGRIFFELNNLPAALDVYTRIISAEPEDFLNHLTFAMILEEMKLIEQAVFQLRCALLLQPDNHAVKSNYQRLIAEIGESKTDIHLSSLQTSFRLYQNKEYGKASEQFSAIAENEMDLFSRVFMGLTALHTEPSSVGAQKLLSVLNEAPYCMVILQALLPTQHLTPTQNDRIKKRMIDLSPQWNENPKEPENDIFVIYQEWTGFQQTRLRTVWQQPASKIIENRMDRLPHWLNLLPICKPFFFPGQHRNTPTAVSFASVGKKIAEKNDTFYQNDYFRAQAVDVQPSQSNESKRAKSPTKHEDENEKPNKLDEAFNWLEKIVTEGISESEEGKSPPKNWDELKEIATEKERSEAVSADHNPDSEKDLTQIREAWNYFSAGEPEKGIQLYRDLIQQNIRPEHVRDDISKLQVLFPENQDLKTLYS